MKKIFLFAAVAALMMTSCGTNGSLSQVGSAVLTDVLTGGQTGATTTTNTGNAVNTVLQSVLGMTGTKVSKQSLIGTWKYSQPGCAFTSEKLLAQAGGEIVASNVKTKLQPTYQKVGINASNTQVTFNQDGTFSAKIAGKAWSGTYKYDENTCKITMSGLLLNVNCYAKLNTNGIGLLFEGKKLLTLIQTMSALSGNNTTIKTIGDVASSYNGLRVGFDMTK
ncbi:DUF4923 family protein [Prevotella communis]|uniref:DUF4923 family protein n=1 Tax=Prevotella communis TaxID=2913614 RepID=UPI001EDB6CD2|nr:DUF4923 family protein [Prevotella communis]UKK67682.1 DUF4923 family protein [Prevotella communis]UKK70171.1 DUF4923 family protein [Prevotella communis]